MSNPAGKDTADVTRLSRAPASETSPGGWLSSSDAISHGRFAPGKLLADRYRIVGLLGKGGMGEVYRADDLKLGQPVALKFLPQDLSRDAARLAQFHGEVRLARQISHPNVCRVYDIDEVDGLTFLSMEYVDGEDLASSLRRIGRFAEDKALECARQLCAGVAAAHDRGILHRDLKPANVMIDGRGHVRVMDFGLAVAAGADVDARAGTPAYMAPEQLAGKEVTVAADIYALGLVLYEMFTGRRVFEAPTLGALIKAHDDNAITTPRSIVSALDPAIERAILRCLATDPAARPRSALAVAAALPGGDPLAAALAAGETPSPAMVAAAGQGAGLQARIALPVLVAVLIGIATSYGLALRRSPLDALRPELTPDMLTQKAREAIQQIGYDERPADEAIGMTWANGFIDYVRRGEQPLWHTILSQQPSPILFRYRRSQSAMVGTQFHHDLLTPGIVDSADPPPIESGMLSVTLDHRGFLRTFEAIPPQVEEAPAAVSLDWTPLFKLAGLDMAALQPATPQWNWLGTSDTRAAWTGTWPGSGRPLRVEAAALHGRPVAFAMSGSWTTPWRTPSATGGGDVAFVAIILTLCLSMIVGAIVLVRKNVRAGRGDQRGALTLGVWVVCMLWALWVCQVHGTPSIGMVGNFLFAIATTTFYGVLFWAIYLALEPFVRRYWPQTLLSWTTLLGGRVRDEVVGRDVLIGAAFGVSLALLVRMTSFATGDTIEWPPIEMVLGLRAAVGGVILLAIYSMRTALFAFFLLFLLRALVGHQRVAAVVFATIFAVVQALTSDHALIDGASTFVYFSLIAAAVMRWGLTSLTIGLLTANLLLAVPATADLSAWYLPHTVFALAIPLALAVWGFYTSLGGRVFKNELFT